MEILLLFFLSMASGSRLRTVVMEPKTEECFVTPITTRGPLVVEYMVMDTELDRELDNNFRVTTSLVRGSMATMLHSEKMQGEGTHVIHPKTIGNYKTCFHNKFSNVNNKTVYFTVHRDQSGGQIQSNMSAVTSVIYCLTKVKVNFSPFSQNEYSSEEVEEVEEDEEDDSIAIPIFLLLDATAVLYVVMVYYLSTTTIPFFRF